MELIELILKLGWIGWKEDISNIDHLFDWLYREYGICLENHTDSSYMSLIFQNRILCKYFGIKKKEDIVERILPDVMLLWKCEDGVLSGPCIEYYEEPNTYWT